LSWADLTDQQNQQSRYWVFHRWQRLCLGWHTLRWICSGKFGLSYWGSLTAGRDFCTKA
jgi:hypothetical protein